tara:strand:+ start:621 stop:815 length:195 start_codon:yes stop_codon:yes gene_type:complete
MKRKTKPSTKPYNYNKLQFPKDDDTLDAVRELADILTEEDPIGRRCCLWQAVKVAVNEALEDRS